MKKLTPWFPAKVKPAHVGVYMTRWFGFVEFQHWDGCGWCFPAYTAREASLVRVSLDSYPTHEWRGLAVKP